MITISQQQALWRWDRLPGKLREALASEVNADFVSTVCGDQHLPPDNIKLVSKLVGYVICGFLHPEDLAREIKIQGGVPEQVAATIADGLNKRIFAPIRSDIDKVFNPQPDEGPLEEESGEEEEFGPKIFEEIRSSLPRTGASSPSSIERSEFQPGWSRPSPFRGGALPLTESRVSTQAQSAPSLATPVPKPPIAPASPRPTSPPIGQSSRSDITPARPRPPAVQAPSAVAQNKPQSLSQISRTQVTPPPASTPRAGIPIPPPARNDGQQETMLPFRTSQDPMLSPLRKNEGPTASFRMDEGPKEVPLAFSSSPARVQPSSDRIQPASTPPTSSPSPRPAPPSVASAANATEPVNAAEPMPIILHEEPASAPTKSSRFNFTPRPPSLSDVTPSDKNIPSKPAVLEFGKSGSAPTAPKVVHYSEMKTPLPPTPPKPPTPQV